MSVLHDPTVGAAIGLAWSDSDPGAADAHEEGGFVLRRSDGVIEVERWPRGARNQIDVPDHVGGCRGDAVIVATFHTHPNPGAGFQQEPSLTDIRAVRNDPDLHHTEYEGNSSFRRSRFT